MGRHPPLLRLVIRSNHKLALAKAKASCDRPVQLRHHDNGNSQFNFEIGISSSCASGEPLLSPLLKPNPGARSGIQERSGATPGATPETHSWHQIPLLKPTPGQEWDSGVGSGATPGATPETDSWRQIPLLKATPGQEWDSEPSPGARSHVMKPTPGATPETHSWRHFP